MSMVFAVAVPQLAVIATGRRVTRCTQHNTRG